MKAFKIFCGLFLLMVCCSEQINAQSFSVKGSIQMDAFYGIHEADTFSNGFNNRRARMGMGGKITDKWDALIVIEFADGSLAAADVRMRRTFDNGAHLMVGQTKVPIGFNENTGSGDLTFMERSVASNSIAISRRMGITYDYYLDNMGFSAMLFGRSLGQRSSLQGDMPIGVALRGVYAPEVFGGRLHMGAAVAFEDLVDNNEVRFRASPEVRDSKGGSLSFANISLTEVESTLRTGLELLFIKGPFSLEGEYLHALVKRSSGANPAFAGFHVQTSYVLTGENRSYSKGRVSAFSPSRESGAWEIAARYSHIDLNDKEFLGGDQNNITLGLNYYVTSKFRFMLNIVFVRAYAINETPVLGGMRAQMNF